jgi:hypothetical protein
MFDLYVDGQKPAAWSPISRPLAADEGVRAAYLGRGYIEIAAEVEGEGAAR